MSINTPIQGGVDYNMLMERTTALCIGCDQAKCDDLLADLRKDWEMFRSRIHIAEGLAISLAEAVSAQHDLTEKVNDRVALLEEMISSAEAHVTRQQFAGSHEQDRIDAVEWLVKYHNVLFGIKDRKPT